MGGACCVPREETVATLDAAREAEAYEVGPLPVAHAAEPEAEGSGADAAAEAEAEASAMMAKAISMTPRAGRRTGGTASTGTLSFKEERARSVELLISKEGSEEQLGMDVKHVQGRLVVVEILPGKAADRAVRSSLQRKPPGDVLEVGDVIVQVNDATKAEAMVREIKTSLSLRVRAERPAPLHPA